MAVGVVILPQNGDDARTQRSAAAAANGDAIAKILRKKKPAELVGVWKQKSGGELQLWGWREGKAGQENKHELPPPHDEVLLFGDVVVVSAVGGSLRDFTAELWAAFYDEAFGGFEEIGEKDSDTDDDDDDVGGDVDDDEDDEDEDEDEDEGEGEGEDEEDGDAEEEEEEAEEDGDCYDEGEEGGGGKRRAVRRRTAADAEYRRIDMGLRARLKMPTPPGKRAPRWQTAPELEAEDYA